MLKTVDLFVFGFVRGTHAGITSCLTTVSAVTAGQGLEGSVRLPGLVPLCLYRDQNLCSSFISGYLRYT